MRALVTILGILIFISAQAQICKLKQGRVQFVSKARSETITAQTDKFHGAIDLQKCNFSFSVNVASFAGFNSKTQQAHFCENYLETELFPKASFTGRIIEQVNFTKNGVVEVRSKGLLTIHGVSKERIIKVTLNIKEDQITFKTNFDIYLKEHNITLPRIVNDKLNNVIVVQAQGVFLK